MKKFFSAISFLLALLFCLGCVGCSGGGTGPATDAGTGTDTPADNTPLLICSPTEEPFRIVRAELADDTVKAAASRLFRTLTELTGNPDVEIREDWVKEGGTVSDDVPEILVGATNRVESGTAAAALPRVLDYSISRIGSKICIYAADSDRVTAAVERFISLLTVTETEGVVETVTLDPTLLPVLDSPDYPLSAVTLGGQPLASCRIVVSASAGAGVLSLAERVRVLLGRLTGHEPEIVRDTVPASGAEIAIGDTSRRTDRTVGATEIKFALAGSTFFIHAGMDANYPAAYAPLDELLAVPAKLAADFTETVSAGLSLDGKRVMFIGNSMLYYGNCVINGDQDVADLGYFYQLCRANGEKCVVTDCTFGSHGLREYIGKCDAGHHSTQIDHLAAYDLSVYDYVVMCQVTATDELSAVCRQIMKRFPNPKTKFIYLCCTYTYQQNHTNMMNQLPLLQKLGITVVNVGELCYNIWKGKTPVPGGKLTYNKDSFIVNLKDSNHPNMLTGYIEALMCYCAITGRSAVGQPYDFATNTSLSAKFDAKAFIKSYYNTGTTNFDKVFASPDEMLGIQQLIDQTNAKWNANQGIIQ